MSEQKLLTVRDVSLLLGISEKEVVNLAENGAIPAYKIGGVYLRFKKDQIQEFQKSNKSLQIKTNVLQKYTFKDKISDFFYFNDFYILAVSVIVLLLIIIFQGY
jgi:excisionase family DNA binding protein